MGGWYAGIRFWHSLWWGSCCSYRLPSASYALQPTARNRKTEPIPCAFLVQTTEFSDGKASGSYHRSTCNTTLHHDITSQVASAEKKNIRKEIMLKETLLESILWKFTLCQDLLSSRLVCTIKVNQRHIITALKDCLIHC